MNMTLTTTTTHSVPVAPTTGALRPLGLDEVTITGGFWGRRQEVNGRATLAHIGGWLEREGWLGNFDLAASGRLPEGRRGREFSDSEVYKYLEAMAWEIGRRGGAGEPTDELEARFHAVVARVAAAQEADGYLNTQFGRPGQRPRWSDLEWGHELYCLGHLFQAAVARVRTRPDADDGLVEVARRAADLVCDVFGEGGIERICGHAEIEVGLAELGRALGEPRYLEQARLFVERHGRGTLRDIEWGRSYFQDDVAVRDADVLRGHAVRANYLCGGCGRRRGRDGRRRAAAGARPPVGRDRRAPHLRDRRAGVAPPGRGVRRGLGAAVGPGLLRDLCRRGIRDVQLAAAARAGRSALRRPDRAHPLQRDRDVAERRRHRVLLREHAAPARPGAEADADTVSPRAQSSLRAPWFDVSCCPPNMARTFASLAAYVATADAAGIQLHQYAPASIRTTLADGQDVALDIATDYPRRVRCGFAWSRMPRSRGPSRCASRRGRRARGWSFVRRGPTPPPRRPSR